jgi:hypothetical protein
VVYKVNPEMHTHRYGEYIERHEDDDIYQEKIKGHKSFTVSDGPGLAELATGDTYLLEEESCPSKKRHRKLKRLLERQERRERLDARVAEADSDTDDFWYPTYLLLS